MILNFPKFGTPEVKKAETSKLFFSHLKKNEPHFTYLQHCITSVSQCKENTEKCTATPKYFMDMGQALHPAKDGTGCEACPKAFAHCSVLMVSTCHSLSLSPEVITCTKHYFSKTASDLVNLPME